MMRKHPLTGELVWHIVDSDFGENVQFKDILNMITEHKGSFPNNITAQLHYNESYDNLFGIHDHEKNPGDQAMPEVAVHWAEDISEDNPLYESVTSFIDNNIGKYTLMSYDKFMELPTDMVRYITEKCMDRAEKEADIQQSILDKALAEKAAATALANQGR